MQEFLDASGVDTSAWGTVLEHFESERSEIVTDALIGAGIGKNDEFRVLDFGYLTGLTQEFLHRDFPGAKITVCDRPDSPNFRDERFLSVVRDRKYVELVPCNLQDIGPQLGKFRVVILGEIIEHMGPVDVAEALKKLRTLADREAVLIVTTPNGAGLLNCYLTMRDSNPPTLPPVPDEVMGYGHIHLWAPSVLRKTAEAAGWIENAVYFYHGREAEAFARLNRAFESAWSQVVMRGVKFLTWIFPKKRGFFVASFKAKNNS